jgi:hypothetical protein
LTTIEYSSRAIKRAQYEAFRFSLRDGDVLVRNESHANPDEHVYLVNINNGRPVVCECPADEQYASACKHRVAVAIRRPVLQAAVRMQALTGDARPEPPS